MMVEGIVCCHAHEKFGYSGETFCLFLEEIIGSFHVVENYKERIAPSPKRILIPNTLYGIALFCIESAKGFSNIR